MMTWMKTFNLPPEGYTYHEFEREDGMLENVIIDHPITGGTMKKDGVPVAYGGFNLIAGRHWVFFFIKDDSIRNHGMWVVRLIRDSVKMFHNTGVRELWALCDTTKPHAEDFLKVLGFEPVSSFDKPVDVMVYEKLMGAKAWRRVQGD